jgi:proline dehydrogenase
MPLNGAPAHKQAFPTLQTSCREEPCPVGRWNVNWLTELDKHVKPEIAAQVKQLMELLIQVKMRFGRHCFMHHIASFDCAREASRQCVQYLERITRISLTSGARVALHRMQAGVSEASIGGTSREILEQMQECAADGEAGLGAFLLP